MYRRYEDPYELEKELEQAKAALKEINPDTHWYEYIDLCNYVQELKDRINFAWQDIEYDESEN